MKILATVVVAFLLSGMVMTANAAEKLYHVVSLKFKPAAAADDIKKVEEAFQDLKKQIPKIVTLDWGTNVSKEKRDKGFTHCFVLTFKNDTDCEDYIADPHHRDFVKILGPVLEDVFVIDFFSKS